jgi:transposase
MAQRRRPTYTPEFRAEAVRLVRTASESVPKIARDLGISLGSLRGWVAATRPAPDVPLTDDERSELRRLRREVHELRMERDILKNVWSAPPLQGVTRAMAETACVNVSGLQVEPQLLALMESARTDPHKAFGHDRPHF